jgi:hypothetical protein
MTDDKNMRVASLLWFADNIVESLQYPGFNLLVAFSALVDNIIFLTDTLSLGASFNGCYRFSIQSTEIMLTKSTIEDNGGLLMETDYTIRCLKYNKVSATFWYCRICNNYYRTYLFTSW